MLHDLFDRADLTSAGRGLMKDASWVKLLDQDSVFRRELGPTRQFGDRFSWKIDLDIQDLEQPRKPRFLTDLASFSICTCSNHSVAPYLKMDWYKIQPSPVLQLPYMCAFRNLVFVSTHSVLDDETAAPKVDTQLQQLLNSLQSTAILQLTMLDPVDRPPLYLSIVRGEQHVQAAMGHFDVPDWWSFHDISVQTYLRNLRKAIDR